MTGQATNLQFDYSKYGFRDDVQYTFKAAKGLTEQVVREISGMKGEPEWMLRRRLHALEIFRKKPVPLQGSWANPELAELNYDEIFYYVRPGDRPAHDWEAVPETIRNTFEKLGIPEAERKFLAGVGAQYECLSGDARVYTTRGLVPICEIQPGDVVFSFDEETNRIVAAEVRATASKGEREVFEVRVGTRRIKATANHPFLALTYQKDEDRVRGRYTRSWKYLHELTAGDLVAVAKDLPDTGVVYTLQHPTIKTQVVGRNQSVTYNLDISDRYNAINLPEITSEDLMWWLGLYVGDGFIHSTEGADKARVEFAIPDSDPGVRAELIRATEELFGITPTSNDTYRVSINSTILARFLEVNGFAGKALTKRVPRWIFGLPQSQKLAFLGGYLDSDGYVRDNAKNHDIMLTSGNRELLQDMAELLSLCGLPTSAIHRFESRHPAEADRQVVGYRLQVAGDYERIGSRSPQRLGRMSKRKYHHDFSSAKGTTFRSHVTEFHGYVKIDSITPAGTEMVYDIEVDGPHNFVAEGIIVHNSEVVYHSLREEWSKLGVIFLDTDSGLREYPELFKQYFGTIVPAGDNKYAALNTAVWSGGSFIYVPKGVHVDIPLQAYFRINAENMGQFERTLIIIEDGASAHYIEGCTAPVYSTNSLHSAVVEIIVKKGGKCRYTTIQNWANNIYNLVTKRAVAYEEASMEWVDGNIGCLAQGSTVTTPEGIRTIESLEPGDQVLSYDERSGQLVFRKVVAKRFSGYQPVHTVSVGERKLRVTANHPFYSYAYDPDAPKKLGRYQLAYVRADHLKEAIVPRTSIDYGVPHRLRKPSLVTEFQSLNQYAADLTMSRARASRLADLEYTTDEIMWLFGYWVGDGNIEVKPGVTEGVVRYATVGFSTPRTDRARGRLIDTMTALVEAEPTERADGYHLNWNSKELAELFSLNGFEGQARNKRVPQWVWSLPESQRLAFIAGYLDADGTVLAEKRRFGLKSANRALLEDIASLLVTLGITPRLHTEFSEPRAVTILGYECTAHGSCRLSFPLDERLLNHVSPRMREVAQACTPAQLEYHRATGRSQIELPQSVEVRDVAVSEASATAVPTWDIEVEGTGNFVSQGFIVHNSRLTMKYPSVYLMGRGARGEVLSVAYAGKGQHQDAGAKMVHIAPDTTSRITNKSVSKDGGKTTYRGLAKVAPGAKGSKINVNCDALILDERSRSDTIPYIEVEEEQTTLAHEATVGRIGAEQLFYLMSRGVPESEALSMIVLGFMEPFTRELPMEYAVELNRLIQLEMEGSLG